MITSTKQAIFQHGLKRNSHNDIAIGRNVVRGTLVFAEKKRYDISIDVTKIRLFQRIVEKKPRVRNECSGLRNKSRVVTLCGAEVTPSSNAYETHRHSIASAYILGCQLHPPTMRPIQYVHPHSEHCANSIDRILITFKGRS